MKKILLTLLLIISFVFQGCSSTQEKAQETNTANDTAETTPGTTENVTEETQESEVTDFDDITFGKEGDKTVGEQKEEIRLAMERAINTEVVWKEVKEYNPTLPEYKHIKAITYDGFEYKGQKTKVFAYIGFPENASADKPVPAIVLIHGGGGHPYLEWVAMWNKRGYAAIAMETTGHFPSEQNADVNERQATKFVYEFKGPFYEEGYVLAPWRSYPQNYTEVQDQWAYHGLSQVILAHNILRQDDRVDNSKIGITGISWGGTMVAQVIGYDNRYSFAIPIYGTAYLGEELRPFDRFAEPYTHALWGAENNLDNAKMPILWMAYIDDNNFGVPSYVKSYQHTEGVNNKNVLAMLGSWGHAHEHAWNKPHSQVFADWVTFGDSGFITFETQPEGREVNCKINIPEGITGPITAEIYYITEPMSYSKHNKYGWGEYVFLDQWWKGDTNSLKVNKDTGTITGTVPKDAAGYYIQLTFGSQGARVNSSSVYVALE